MNVSLPLLEDPAELGAFSRWEGQAGRVAESSLCISGMHCAACAVTIEQALRALPGVLDARVSAAARCATVRWDARLIGFPALVRAVERAGYEAAPDSAAGARALRTGEARSALWRLFVAAFCAMQVMMLATPSYVSAPGELTPDLERLLAWGAWLLTLPVLLFSAAPFFAGAWRALRARRIGMDVPVVIGIAVAFVASSGAAFDPGGLFGREVYFDSLTMFVSFLLAGRMLEMRSRHAAEAALEEATGRWPQRVMRLDAAGGAEMVVAAQLRAGDRVRVPAGEAFVADGLLLEGATAADEALLTGESRPVAKREGDPLVAGSVNLHAPVVMRVLRTGADTRQAEIAAMVRAARTDRPAIVARADRWAGPFLWGVLLLAAAAGAVWSAIDPARAVWVVVSVLIVTCPCALSLAAPSALVAAAGAMAQRGLLLRRLDAIQRLAEMQVLFVDKTGTLTEGQLRCAGTRQLGGADAWPLARLQGIAASLAGWSIHPLSHALREAFEAAPMPWRDVRESPGEGVEAIDGEGRRWRLGSARWALGRAASEVEGSHTCLSCDGRALVSFTFEERLRADAPASMQALRTAGIDVRLVSGDEPRRVSRLAASLGIGQATGGMAPEDKLAAIASAQGRGEVVAMLGDGINDAPVLARADLSIAMGQGAPIARLQADAVLVSNRLADLVAARTLARRALRVMQQNLAWAALYNAACVPIALAGWLPPWAAGAGMAASSLVVVLNSLRLAR